MSRYILTNSEMAEADKITIKNGLPSLQLMEKAGKAVFKNLPLKNLHKILIICGPGNNGGDGFVVAKELINVNKSINIFFPFKKSSQSIDCKYYSDKIGKNNFISKVENLEQYDLIIDALFGTGLSRYISNNLISLIKEVNKSSVPVMQ